MDVQDIIALILAATAVGYVVRRIRRIMSNRGDCGCGQGGKCTGGAASSTDRRDRIRRLPLVSVDQIGTPPATR